MPHTVVKFKTKKLSDNEYAKIYEYVSFNDDYETISKEDAKSWHAISISGDGESTMCGQVYSEYQRLQKTVEKGGITCSDCLGNIKYAKNIKL